ncbi:hypothetical protein AUQ44_16475 [Vibrio cidicii]|uniref:Phage tail fibre protein N-terminal domain-containing protein n=1 Tax=Vibrio cidicii TaxID=1763883 RepID=A0A151JCX4_9VIBR|nr:phage tail protein [Vibrio cidicii]KYN23578.1 hypothetical protein AUQ44_16475 [Vibrio cidicii]
MTTTNPLQILTKQGEELLARLAAEEKELVIDKFIFADVPDRGEFPSREEAIPHDYIVHEEPIGEKGRLTENSVIYTATLASDVGPFYFNWSGLYCSEHNVLVTIHYPKRTPKTQDQPGIAGNTLVRSQVLQYTGVAEITNITVDASTWQYNSNDRLKKMDADVAQALIDQNGKDWFIGDGFQVLPKTDTSVAITPGAGYVSGNRVSLGFERIISVPAKPAYIYLDAKREGTPTGEQITTFNFVVSAEEKDDYIDSSTGKQIPHFVCKIAQVLEDGSVSDLRKDSQFYRWVNQNFITGEGGEEGEVLIKASAGNNDVKWEKLSNYIMTNHPSMIVGEQSKKLLLHQTGGVYQVITKKARNAPGYVMMSYHKTMNVPDENNEFGTSHHRPTTVYEVTHALVGRLKPNSKVAERATLSESFNAAVLGLPHLQTVDYSKYVAEEATSFNGMNPWDIIRDSDYVEYLLNGEFSLLFARSPASTKQVIIEEQQPDGTYYRLDTFSLKYSHNNNGEDAAFIYTGRTSKNKLSVIRVRNGEGDINAHCYLYGANIYHLNEINGKNLIHDTAAYIRDNNYFYIKSAGANDFAFKRNGSKWFGSYHGGHHLETVKRHISTGIYSQHTDGYFEMTERVLFSSKSELHSEGVKEYEVSVETQFFDGGYINYACVNVADGREGVECTDVYTSMTCSDTVFTHVDFPRYVDVSAHPSSKVMLGNNNIVTQTDPQKNSKITSQMTLFVTSNNQYGGLRIDKAAQYNKVYYGPILSNKTEKFPPVYLSDLSFVAMKEFY